MIPGSSGLRVRIVPRCESYCRERVSVAADQVAEQRQREEGARERDRIAKLLLQRHG